MLEFDAATKRFGQLGSAADLLHVAVHPGRSFR